MLQTRISPPGGGLLESVRKPSVRDDAAGSGAAYHQFNLQCGVGRFLKPLPPWGGGLRLAWPQDGRGDAQRLLCGSWRLPAPWPPLCVSWRGLRAALGFGLSEALAELEERAD